MGAQFPHAIPGSNPAHDLDKNPDRVLRIGYLSPDFRRHSVAFFFLNLLQAHDPAQVDVYCYDDSIRKDEITEHLKKLAPHWREITGQSDDRVIEQIHADKIDILVDLAGHTPGNRLPLFNKKPVPIQVTWLGYPDTTGLPEIDYRLTDAQADPTGQTDAWNTERLIRLPGCFLCAGKCTTPPKSLRRASSIAATSPSHPSTPSQRSTIASQNSGPRSSPPSPTAA